MKISSKNLPITNLEDLKTFLPHREPIFLIDTLQYHDETNLEANFTVTAESIFVNENLFSEAGLIEHMAQCVALHIGYSAVKQNLPIREGYIASIKSAEIFELPQIGVTIQTEIEVTHSLQDMSVVNCVSKVDDVTIAKATMSTVLKKETE